MTKSILEERCQLLLSASSGCFVTCRLAPPAWIYDHDHPVGDTRPKVISFQFRTSPSWRERSDRRIWWRG
ncbi:MAG: hypothetical protein FWF18_04480 [Dehalococcoidia bacterium]|nr:hypothetical protein [Dehalococcoidia bacterium]